MKGYFITLEGIEGSGKSTIARRLAEDLRKAGHSVVLTREPGDTPVGQHIRKLLLDPEQRGMHPLTEVLLYLADRAEHVHKVILPALERGEIVICDRFSDSTIAYQGFARGLDVETLRQLDSIARDDIMPDLTIILDLDVTIGLKRNSRANKRDRFELEEVEFHERVRKGFHAIAEENPERVRIVDASMEIEEVYKEVRAIVWKSLPA